MAKVKYNVKGVDSGGGPRVKPGAYIAKVKDIEATESQGDSTKGETMLVVTFQVIKNSDGSKSEFKNQTIKTWLLPDYEPTAFRFRQFLEAVGKVEGKKGETGTLDTDALIGTEVQIQVKSDRDRDGEYMPRVGKVLSLEAAAGSDEEDEDEEPDEEPDDPEEEDDDSEEDEDEDEDEDEEDDEEGVDLDPMTRAQLKAFIKEQELEISVKKSMSDDDIRAAIVEAMGGDEDEDESEEEDEEEPESDGLDDLDRDGLKAYIKEHDLKEQHGVKVLKTDDADDLRAKIRAVTGSGEGEDEAPDYSTWEPAQLKAELQERGIELEGRFGKAKAVKALKEDDGSDSDPF